MRTKQYLLFNKSVRTNVICFLFTRQAKTCLFWIESLDIELINFNSIKTNIKRMVSEIPTNSLINNYLIHQTIKDRGRSHPKVLFIVCLIDF